MWPPAAKSPSVNELFEYIVSPLPLLTANCKQAQGVQNTIKANQSVNKHFTEANQRAI